MLQHPYVDEFSPIGQPLRNAPGSHHPRIGLNLHLPPDNLRVSRRMPGLGGGVRFFGGYKLLRGFGISRMGKFIGVNLII